MYIGYTYSFQFKYFSTICLICVILASDAFANIIESVFLVQTAIFVIAAIPSDLRHLWGFFRFGAVDFRKYQ